MDCIKTLEDISLFIDKSKKNYAKSRKNFMPKSKYEHLETTESEANQIHVIKSEVYEDDLQYFNGFEICQICYSRNILKPVEEKAHLMQLFQDITNIVVEAEVTSSNRTSVCNNCINELETISLFIRVSVSNEMKLKNSIGRYEALEIKNCLEGNAIDMGYGNKVKNDDDFDENAHSYESESLRTIIYIKEEIVDTSEAYIGQINRNGMNIYNDSNSEDNPLDCDPCKDEFSTGTHLKNLSKGLEINLDIQSGTNRFKCDCCDKSFTRKQILQKHVLIHSEERPFRCECCEKRFNHESNLQKHMLIHSGEKPFECGCCKKSFALKGNLQNHMLIHSREKPFGCECCEKRFNNKSNSRKHMLIHSGEKPFKCDFCKRSFAHRGNLQTHMNIHTGKRPFKCECCEKRFTQKGNLQNHMLCHSGEKPFKCGSCKKSFALKGNLQTHMIIHTGKRQFKCECCEKRFTKKRNLQNHMMSHSGEKPIKCDKELSEIEITKTILAP